MPGRPAFTLTAEAENAALTLVSRLVEFLSGSRVSAAEARRRAALQLVRGSVLLFVRFEEPDLIKSESKEAPVAAAELTRFLIAAKPEQIKNLAASCGASQLLGDFEMLLTPSQVANGDYRFALAPEAVHGTDSASPPLRRLAETKAPVSGESVLLAAA